MDSVEVPWTSTWTDRGGLYLKPYAAMAGGLVVDAEDTTLQTRSGEGFQLSQGPRIAKDTAGDEEGYGVRTSSD